MEINELHTMFKKNGIEMTMDELFKIFSIVDADGNGSLSLDEF
jgi:Ca2+-binding EF-hand superfamily protein